MGRIQRAVGPEIFLSPNAWKMVSCTHIIRTAFLHDSDTWAMNAEDLWRLERVETGMLCCMSIIIAHVWRSATVLREKQYKQLVVKDSGSTYSLMWEVNIQSWSTTYWVNENEMNKPFSERERSVFLLYDSSRGRRGLRVSTYVLSVP